MNAKNRKRLVQALPAILIAILLLGRRYQPELGHLLSMAYLFWDYVLTLAIVLLLALAIIWRRARVPALLAAMIVCIDFISPTLQDWHRNAGPVSGPTLKVITFNWLSDGRDRSEIFAWLKEENPDVVAIQEMNENEESVATTLFGIFPYHTKPIPDVVILSKYPVIKQASKTIDGNSMVRAELNVQDRRLVVWNIHPSSLKELTGLRARDRYLAVVAQYVRHETDSVLMMGDFNSTRWDPAFREIVAAGQLHEQPELLAHPTRMAVRKGLPFFGSPIDHILADTGSVLSECRTGPNLGSDHKPLICNLTLNK